MGISGTQFATSAQPSEARDASALDAEILLASRPVGDRLRQTYLSVPGIHCGGCIQRIEKALAALTGVEHARVNLSTKRVSVRWKANDTPPPLLATLKALGYEAHLQDMSADDKDPAFSELVRALAVAGFAASNIMLLSVSIWSGAEPATRDLFHWISAFIALPALAYSGRIFFRSAWKSLRRGEANMDVPISIGVLMAFGMSLYDTIHHGENAYFDASISLLFFLLIGRTLDHLMREKARTAVKGLAAFTSRGAMIVQADGSRDYLPIDKIEPGMRILLAAGERVPVDARVEDGSSDLDNALVSGESMPVAVARGSMLQAGTLNLTGPLTIVATAAARDSFLAEMLRLMEAAEAGRSGYRRLADRASRLYAPVVHLAALLSFFGWLLATGDFHRAITIAVAVLIITCPCALGLAVPMVQVVAARRLFENGIMVKDGSALERLNEIDTVVFDKTGTLTLGRLNLRDQPAMKAEIFALAAAMAAHSRHPRSLALYAAAVQGGAQPVVFDSVSERPGFGLEATQGANVFRLGRSDWALEKPTDALASSTETETVLSKDGVFLDVFHFEDFVRPGAREAIAALKERSLAVEIVSGDNMRSVRQVASLLDVRDFKASALPGEKVARISALSASGHKVMMVGDGINDTPALAAAHVSMAPATAADVGRNAADFVFLHESLSAVPQALAISHAAGRLIRQNFALAVAYNAIALPIAVLGYVTPLVAALAMSGSSIIVVANALRLKGHKQSYSTSSGKTHMGKQAPLGMEPAE
ncbi:MAG: cation-translocating P-type ATPase [Parvibaculum sp.]|uniref:cation-translocating P-type ATPase n=1 Tax=Parvibaculum sp. TaxID=2024848 RepID=UPI003C733BCA